MSISLPLLYLLFNVQEVAFGFTVLAPSASNRCDVSLLVAVSMASTDGELEQQQEKSSDEYDDWYADFNPAIYGDYAEGSYEADYDMTPRRGNRRGGGGRGGNGRFGHDYQRDIEADNSHVDLEAVESLISDRLQARKTGRFEEADAIRDQLLKEHGVMLRDKERLWRSGCSESGSGRKWMLGDRQGGDRQGGDRQGARKVQRRPSGSNTFGPNGHDYNLSPEAGPNQSALPDAEIHRLLAERLACKLSRDFYGADQIQEELLSAGVWVHDGRKEWRADGRGFGRPDSTSMKPSREPGSRSDRFYQPYEKSSQSQPIDAEQEEQILSLLNDRMKAKQARNYDVADGILQELLDDFDVTVNDRTRQWSVGGQFVDSGSNRFQGRAQLPYIRAPASEIPDNPEAIQRLVDLRDQARKSRDFVTADSILEDLRSQNVDVDDKTREWAVGGYFSNNAVGAGREEDGMYARRGGGSITEEDEAQITKLLQERYACQRDKQFGQADRIRDRLRDEFQVRIDDKNKEWHIVTSEYVMAVGSHPLDAATQAYVEEQVKKRAIAKLNRDYTSADAIRDELMDDYLVYVDDRLKEWKAMAGVSASMESDEDDISTDYEISDAVIDDEEVAENEISNETIDELTDDETPVGSKEETQSDTENLESLTVPELKDRLRDLGLPVSGRKAELIERLQNR